MSTPILDEFNQKDSVLQQKINTIINILTIYCGKANFCNVTTKRLQQTWRIGNFSYFGGFEAHFLFRYKYAWWSVDYFVAYNKDDDYLSRSRPNTIRLTLTRERPYFWKPYLYPEISFNTDLKGNLSIKCEPVLKDQEIKQMLDTLYSECLTYRQKVTISLQTETAQAILDRIETEENAKARGNRLTKLFEQE